jgi:hypothetical protein
MTDISTIENVPQLHGKTLNDKYKNLEIEKEVNQKQGRRTQNIRRKL